MSSNEERESLVREFCLRTKTTQEKATTALEADSWDLELALYNYYLIANACEDSENTDYSPIFEHHEHPAEDSDSDSRPGAGSSVVIKKKNKSKAGKNSKFGTLQSLHQENSSDEEEGQAFYAGGSVRSGQQILGPGKNTNDIVANMFKSAREHGGMILNQESESSTSKIFTGTGYKLGATPDDTVVIKDPSTDKTKRDSESVILRLWRNGFSLNEENLRPYSDPANEQFLEYIRRGELPPELRNCSELILTMEDRRNEEFSKTSSGPSKPFHGKGYMLGSPAPTISGSTSRQSISSENVENTKENVQDTLNINENEPTTNIQFRLADGTRISGRFNLTHTIANLREYIVSSVPSYQSQTFILLTTFPNKELTDLNQTVKDAGLMNALVVQRLQ